MGKDEIINLDTCVENALELFTKEKLPKLSIPYKRPLVVGSGNAAVTGRIIFGNKDAVFADESTYKEKLKSVKVDGAVLISASGGKHAPILAKALRKKKISTMLLTNNKDALAISHVDKSYVFPKNPEPYTYNTSTYLSMIFGKTKENPKTIQTFIRRSIKNKIPDFSKYTAFFIIVPNELDSIREMFTTKFDELFGGVINGRVFTEDQIKHAKTLVETKKECFIGLGVNNKDWGLVRYNFPLPKGVKHAGAIAIGYWIIGQIQKQKPPYFKRGLEAYTKKVSRMFNQDIKPVVE